MAKLSETLRHLRQSFTGDTIERPHEKTINSRPVELHDSDLDHVAGGATSASQSGTLISTST